MVSFWTPVNFATMISFKVSDLSVFFLCTDTSVEWGEEDCGHSENDVMCLAQFIMNKGHKERVGR